MPRAECWSPQEECPAHAAAQEAQQQPAAERLSWVETWARAPQPPAPAQAVTLVQQFSIAAVKMGTLVFNI